MVRELAVRLRGPEAHVEVACLSSWGPVADQLKAAGVAVTALNARGCADLRVVPRLIRLIDQGRFDTVFSFLVHANAVAAAAAALRGSVRYLQSIQTAQPKPRWHWWLQRIIHPAAEKIVVATESVAKAAGEWSGVAPEKIVIIANAIDPADYPGLGAGHWALASQHLAGPFPIGFIGRLDPVKRIPDLLEAVHRLSGLVQLHVFGEGGERRRIESEIARLGVSDCVTMHGAAARPQEALEKIGLLVLPSAAEGFGLVLIEAMAAGVPVVATNVPGIRDVVRDGQTGLLVPAASPQRLAEAIERMVRDAAMRRRIAEEAAADVRQRFSWEKVIEQYRALLCGTPSGGGLE